MRERSWPSLLFEPESGETRGDCTIERMRIVLSRGSRGPGRQRVACSESPTSACFRFSAFLIQYAEGCAGSHRHFLFALGIGLPET